MTKPIRKPAQETMCWTWPTIQVPTLGSSAVSPETIDSVNFFSQAGSFVARAVAVDTVLVAAVTGSIAPPVWLVAISPTLAGGVERIFPHREEAEAHSPTFF